MATGSNGKNDGDLSGSVGSGTQIDLGEDLLEKTAHEILRAKGTEPTEDRDRSDPSPLEIQDRVQSARILFNEGLIEEAKKTLRQVLIDDPANAFAKQQLGEIHKLELKQIFGGSVARRNIYAPKDAPGEDLSAIDAPRILHRLDQDLGLGFFDGEGAESPIAQLSIFADPEEMERFAAAVDRDLRQSRLEDRIDLGIGFLEMGLYELAARQFRHVHKRARPSVELLISSTALLAYALILSGRSFDASLVLQPVVTDPEIPITEKLELFYLMGRSQEMLANAEVAAEWYLQVRGHDPFYRDIEERLRRMGLRETGG